MKNYTTTKSGQIINIISGKTIKLMKSSNGYLQFTMSDMGKRITTSVHREVAKQWIPNPENKLHVNHINGNKEDNRIENLQWCTPSENEQHSFNVLNKNFKGEKNNYSKLTNKQVLEIRSKNNNCKFLAEEYNVSYSLIRRIIKKQIWKHI